MATITKAALGDLVLQHLGVLAAGATSATADQTLTQQQIDVVMSQMRALKLAPFESSAIPEYAQQIIRDIVAFKLAPTYGVTGQRLNELAAMAKTAEWDMGRQTTAFKQPRRTRFRTY